MRTGGSQLLAPRPVAPSPRLGREAVWGAALGVLLWVAALQVGIRAAPGLGNPHMVALCGAAGGLIGLTRARWILRAAGVCLAALLLAVGYVIPLPEMARAWPGTRERSRVPARAERGEGAVATDRLPRLEVVVALSARARADGTPDDQGQLRLLRAYELLKSGTARRLVITRIAPPIPSTLAAVRGQMGRLGLNYPVEEVGPTRNTHDEALAVAALARRRGWKKILLVTDPMHLRRAAAVFTTAGLTPYCAPSQPHGYDPNGLDSPRGRWNLFREWLREYVGYRVYQWRGWITDDHRPTTNDQQGD